MQTDFAPTLFRPPAPPPLREPLGTFEFLRRVRANPLATWADEHFSEPIVAGEGVLGRITVVSDPAAVKHVLVDNAANYRKDDLQKRVLAPGLGNGLLTAGGGGGRGPPPPPAPPFFPPPPAARSPPPAPGAGGRGRRRRRRPRAPGAGAAPP